MKNRSILLVLIMFAALFIAACTNNNQPTDGQVKEDIPKEDKETTRNNEPQEGGTITAAMYTAPGGQFNPIFYEDAFEANILDFTHESLVEQNEKMEFIPSLARDWKFNEDQTELTYFLEESVKWHDGEEFTADDVVFTFSTLANQGYVEAGGVHTSFVNKLVGYEEYTAGETEELEGVEAKDDYTVTFTFKEPNVTAIANTSISIIPEHVFRGTDVRDIPKHPGSIKPGEVIGTGPFQFTAMQEGEQYILEKHEEYWKGEPYLDGIQWRVIDQEVMTGMLETGEVDLVKNPVGVPKADKETVAQMDHITMFEQQDLGYQLLGFKLHHGPDDALTDKSKWVVNEKVQDKKLRQAIAYAINREGMVEGLLYGSGKVLNAPIPEESWAYDPDAAHHYEYSEEKANALLDEAGYVDEDGDGFREKPDGETFSLNLDYSTGNKVRERSAPIIQENLEAVGLKVNLRQPREASAHFQLLENNDTDWDMYLLGWGLSSADPDPSAIHQSDSVYNYLRWDNEESDKLIREAVQTPEAFDLEYRKEKYAEWAKLFSEELPEIPLYSENNIFAHNSKLHGITRKPHTIVDDAHEWWLDRK